MRLAAALALLPILAPPAAGQPAAGTAEPPNLSDPASPDLQPAQVQALVSRLADLLAEYYVHAGTGRLYADMLRRRLAAGEYGRAGSARQLAAKLSEDLQATARDGHLRVIAPGGVTPQRMVMGSGAGAIEAGGWIAEGIAYLRLAVLPGSPEGLAALETFLRDHGDARTLIVDARATPGGAGDAADLIMSHLFSAPQPLLRMEMRDESFAAGWAPVREGPLVRRIAAPAGMVGWERSIAPHPTETRLQDAQIFYLTSRRTGSAAEALALALKRTGRATLIGENSYGAGYFTRPLELGAGFAVNLPIGRTYDPDTGRDFEGSGVAPDIAVPAERALEEALRRAGLTAAQDIEAAVARAS